MEIILKIIVWILTLILLVWEYVSPPPGSAAPIWLVIKIIILVIITVIIVIELRQKKATLPQKPKPKTLPPDIAPPPGPDAPRPKK